MSFAAVNAPDGPIDDILFERLLRGGHAFRSLSDTCIVGYRSTYEQLAAVFKLATARAHFDYIGRALPTACLFWPCLGPFSFLSRVVSQREYR